MQTVALPLKTLLYFSHSVTKGLFSPELYGAFKAQNVQ